MEALHGLSLIAAFISVHYFCYIVIHKYRRCNRTLTVLLGIRVPSQYVQLCVIYCRFMAVYYEQCFMTSLQQTCGKRSCLHTFGIVWWMLVSFLKY